MLEIRVEYLFQSLTKLMNNQIVLKKKTFKQRHLRFTAKPYSYRKAI